MGFQDARKKCNFYNGYICSAKRSHKVNKINAIYEVRICTS